MSERGSFVTEYIYCATCFAAVKAVLCAGEPSKWLTTVHIEPYPIIAGKIGGNWAGEEAELIADVYGPQIAPRLCHTVRIAVLCESIGTGVVVEIRHTTIHVMSASKVLRVIDVSTNTPPTSPSGEASGAVPPSVPPRGTQSASPPRESD